MNSPQLQIDLADTPLTRRELLAAGSVGVLGLGMQSLSVSQRSQRVPSAKSCIMLLLNGAPSQLDTFDPHPDAPSEVRGPFNPIATRIPGVFFTEIFPQLAARVDKLAIIRSMHSDAAANHDASLAQWMLAGSGSPGIASVLEACFAPRNGVPPYVVLPGEPAGAGSLGNRLQRARMIVERGARLVVVPMFDTLLGHVTWDCHDLGGTLASTLDDYKTTLGPTLDCALAALLDDLSARCMLDDTLVLCMGEMGRAPRIGVRTRGGVGAGPNGRDHWTGVWSILAAGGGIQGGQVLGASDKLGAEPRERPVTPAEIVAMVYERLGIAARPAKAYGPAPRVALNREEAPY